VEQVVALARSLADAREHGVAAVLLGHVPDQLLDDHRLAHARAAEDAHLAALGEGADQVDHLEPGLEHLGRGGLVLEGGGLAMDGVRDLALDRSLAVDRLAQHVEHPAQRVGADRDRDRGTGVRGLGSACQAVGRGHGHGAHPVVAEVLLDLAHQGVAVALDADRVEDPRQPAGRELDVHHRPGDLDHPANGLLGLLLCGCGGRGECHDGWILRARRQAALAPVAISIISRVMFAWRTLL
jgi:hypothetical protein